MRTKPKRKPVPMIMTTVKVPVETHNELCDHAEASGVTFSVAVRETLKAGLVDVRAAREAAKQPQPAASTLMPDAQLKALLGLT